MTALRMQHPRGHLVLQLSFCLSTATIAELITSIFYSESPIVVTIEATVFSDLISAILVNYFTGCARPLMEHAAPARPGGGPFAENLSKQFLLQAGFSYQRPNISMPEVKAWRES